MANDFIKCNTTDGNAFMAADIVRLAKMTRELLDLADSVRDRGFRLFETNPLDFSGFEAACGIPEGSGQTVFDLVNGTRAALLGEAQNANAVELKSRVG